MQIDGIAALIYCFIAIASRDDNKQTTTTTTKASLQNVLTANTRILKVDLIWFHCKKKVNYIFSVT